MKRKTVLLKDHRAREEERCGQICFCTLKGSFSTPKGPRLVLQDGQDIFSHLNLNSCELCIMRKITFLVKLFIENMQKVKHTDRFLIQKYELSLVMMIKMIVYFC